jgi:type IV secretion system protein VirB6
MGFYTEFASWLDALLATYVADQTARIAAAIEPLLITLCVLYVMIWGYLALFGKVQEPLTDAIKRFFAIVLVFAVAIHLCLYNDVIVTAVFDAPASLAAVVVGTYEHLAVIDQVLQDGMDTGGRLMARGSLFNGFSFDIAGIAVCILVGVVAVYAMFLLSLSKVALSVLLAIGPLFLISVLFNATRRFIVPPAASSKPGSRSSLTMRWSHC